MDQTLVELNEKLDRLTAQVNYLTEQAQLAERQRQERAELMHDVMPIVNNVFRLTTEQLEEVQHYADLDDLLCVLKHLLRNTRNLGKMLEQLESLMDLLQTVGPLTDEAFGAAVDKLAEAERKGYFAFARGAMQIADNIVTSFTEEDVRALGDNIVLILNVVKDLTQPQILSFVKNTVTAAEAEIAKPVDTSLIALLRQLNDPAVRRGLALTLRILRVIGSQG
ncbi:MAG: DUF1641 domain-containing protein [Anaerolineae bacterium]